MTILKTQLRKHMSNESARIMVFLFENANEINLALDIHRRMLAVCVDKYEMAVPFVNMLNDAWKNYFNGYMDCLREFPYTNKLMYELLTDIKERYELVKLSEEING